MIKLIKFEKLSTQDFVFWQGAFHVYGAKTSRQVFLFEKGVVIAKKKEDAMLSCKIFIQVSFTDLQTDTRLLKFFSK